ncbi:hypothetical protein Dvina_37995 [Dactylosporangium vinaceum]|uniref:Uncharacterized protein n=1 Tax=Dactylosporangium vinaceum TaxID=53362 RepID=A0ABV5MKU5_9ACTN|nr:hypothetical protein Dvina_37995 [Dactylosporangium vinaceum]
MTKVERQTHLVSGFLPELLDGLMVPAVGCGPHWPAAWVNCAARALSGAHEETRLAPILRPST